MVNACVTGVLPRFRYVLLTDALIESLSPSRWPRSSATRSATWHTGTSPSSASSSWAAWECWRWRPGLLDAREPGFASLPWIPAGQLPQVGEIVEAVAILGCSGRLLLAGLRAPLAAVRAAGRRLRLQGRLLRRLRMPSPSRSRGRTQRLESANSLSPGALPRSVSRSSRCAGQRRHARTASTPLRDPGGTAASPTGWPSSSNFQANPAGETSFQRGVRSYPLRALGVPLSPLSFAILTRSWELLG